MVPVDSMAAVDADIDDSGEKGEGEHVIDHRCPENDRGNALFAELKIMQHPGTDGNSCDGQSEGDKQAVFASHPEDHAGKVGDDKWNQKTGDANGKGLSSVFVEIERVGFEPGIEHQEEDAEVGENVQHLVRIDQAEKGRAEDNAGGQFAKDRRLVDGAAEHAGGPDDDHQHQQVERRVVLRHLRDDTENAFHISILCR